MAVLTTTRADWGLVRTVCRALGPSLRLVVSGTHLSARHGATESEILSDGLSVAARVPIFEDAPPAREAMEAAARILSGMGAALARLQPDLLLLAGDRYEMTAAALAAQLARVPFAHLAGGETDATTTPDGNFRNALTKLAAWHFATCDEYARRIRAMGEEADRVFVTGLPSLDELSENTGAAAELEQAAGLSRLEDPRRPFVLVTHLPVVFRPRESLDELQALLAVLAEQPHLNVLLTGANADQGGAEGAALCREFAERHGKRCCYVESLGHRAYLRAVQEAAVVLGNSSSGIIETPSFGTPSVTVGRRQVGRFRAPNVLEGGSTRESIAAALQRALEPGFRAGLRGLVNPFAAPDGKAGRRIAGLLQSLPITRSALEKRLVTGG
ncbi:MAG: UDP-N-acetylglucosamine 2-epimerase (hydrolyzing) [Planctomycetes bacterium]|nr:UDP-N-acetylglucosamine 2-epimerase (hydrolyzing) [Planctomycetota bacterium]